MGGILQRERMGTAFLLIISGMFFLTGNQNLHAQEFPTKAINLIIPFGAGGGSDLTARAIFTTAPEYLGQPIVVHIKPGGGGAIGSEFVAQSKPDGYTLLFGHTNCQTILPIVEGRSRPADQYEPVAHIGRSPGFFLARPDAPFKNFKEMIAWAKANPGKLTYGNTGIWSVADIMWKAIEHQFGLKTRIVDYPGGGEALVALLGGHVQVIHNAAPQSLPHIKAGKLIPLGFSGNKRHPDLPDLPTQKEQGFDAAPFCSWKGILAPKGTPRPAIEKLALGFQKMMGDKAAQPRMKQLGDDFEYMGPDDFKKFLTADFHAYSELAKIFKK